jgi:NADPH2:quinone reductase
MSPRADMQAAYFETFGAARDVLKRGRVDIRAPQAGAVRVRLHASGINPYDVKYRAGRYGGEVPSRCVVPHTDGAGIVEAVGAGLDPSLIGTRVWIWGAAQDDRAGTAAETVTVPLAHAPSLPADLSLDEGACLGIPYLTAYQNVLRDGAVRNHTILVSGGGGAVGFLAIQIARLSGATVIATAGTAATIAHAKAGGADAVIDYRRDNVPERVRALTDGAGVDRLVEVEFGANIGMFTRIMRPGGIVSSYGSAAAMTPLVDFAALQAHGMTLHFHSVHRMDARLRAEAIAALPRFVADGMRMPPTRSFDFVEIVAAHEAVEAGAGVERVIVHLDDDAEPNRS